MKKNYQIDGISGGGCIMKVKEILESHPLIDKVEISSNSLGATAIKMKEKIETNYLQQILREVGNYTIHEKK
ncbi:copper resistance protein CopZ [bacterium]|nr:copper resistance protein CopZ [bacterium]